MSVELNHTIIPVKDKWVWAKLLADILNLKAGRNGVISSRSKTANGVTLDFDTREESGRGIMPPLSAMPSSTRRSRALRRSAAHQAGRDQSSARRSRCLFRRPRRSLDGNNHPPYSDRHEQI
jgi:hypothetical protein